MDLVLRKGALIQYDINVSTQASQRSLQTDLCRNFLLFGNFFCMSKNHSTYRDNEYSVAVYQKYLTRLGKLIIFESLDIFDIRQHYIRGLFIFQRLICSVLFFLTPTNMNLAVYGNKLAVVMTS